MAMMFGHGYDDEVYDQRTFWLVINQLDGLINMLYLALSADRGYTNPMHCVINLIDP